MIPLLFHALHWSSLEAPALVVQHPREGERERGREREGGEREGRGGQEGEREGWREIVKSSCTSGVYC